jgi:two-component sensor histidine kinase/Tfp pilus assembly protein PilF
MFVQKSTSPSSFFKRFDGKMALIFLLTMLPFAATHAQKDPIAEQVTELIDQAWDFSLANNDSALIVSEQALNLSRQNKYPLGEVYARESMGLYHEMVTGDISEASEQYFRAIDLCETHQLDYISSVYHSLGVMFHTTDNYENAKRYYFLSLEKAENQGDSLLIKKCLINLGSVHSSLQDFETSEAFLRQSLAIPLQPDMDYTTYANLGNMYVKQGKYSQAIPFLQKATEKNSDNPDADLNVYFLLEAKRLAKDSTNMRSDLERAKKAVETGAPGIRDQSLLLRTIADCLAFLGNYKEALSYRDQYIRVFEEIKEKQRDRIVLDMESKYESKKKDDELKVLKLEAEKKEQQIRFFAFLGVAALIIAGLIGFFLYKNREKNKLLIEQKRQLEENVEEINLLLKEIHHRVKNNLQVITSLLNIQQRSISDQKAKEAIQESKNRIRSMGLIHRNFYQDKNLGEINTRKYVTDLVNQLLESYEMDTGSIQLETSIDEILLDMDVLVPLGLIINELVSNSLKHAFGDQQEGKLFISLEKSGDILRLEVSDNGTGLSDLSEMENSNSFGFSMVKAFVSQLDGHLELLNGNGATFRIEFAA